MVPSTDLFSNEVLTGMYNSYKTSRQDHNTNLSDMDSLFWVSEEAFE